MRHDERKLGQVAVILFIIFIAFEIFSGVLRFALDKIGIVYFIYLPKLFGLAFCLTIFLVAIKRFKVRRGSLVLFLALTTAAFVGLTYTGCKQLLFGIWSASPFLFSFFSYPFIRNYLTERNIFRWSLLALLTALCGFIINYLYPTVPWMGYIYNIGGTNIEGMREWVVLDYQRIGGFSRGSFSLAYQIVLFGLIVYYYSKSKIKSFILFLILLSAILFTTMKTAFVVFMGVSIICSLYVRINKTYLRRIFLCIPLLLLIAGCYLPLLSYKSDLTLGIDSIESKVLLGSLEDRLINTWPNFIAMIDSEGSLIFGRGLGGVGSATFYWESALNNPIDNLYLYIYGVFGVFGVLILFLASLELLSFAKTKSHLNDLFFILVVALMFIGIAFSSIEGDGLTSLFFGISMAHISSTYSLDSRNRKVA